MKTPPTDPFELFAAWFDDARAAEPSDPNAMSLATVDAGGRPSVRIVLMKAWDRDGFVFYTNLESRKATALAANPAAELLFHWKSAKRQIRIAGAVAPVADDIADAYFASRPRDSRLAAWASLQSRPLADRAAFEARLAEAGARFPGEGVPRPPFWSGLRVAPERFEYWEERAFRQHERWSYARHGDGWRGGWLYP